MMFKRYNALLAFATWLLPLFFALLTGGYVQRHTQDPAFSLGAALVVGLAIFSWMCLRGQAVFEWLFSSPDGSVLRGFNRTR